jgi:hypothetical protein
MLHNYKSSHLRVLSNYSKINLEKTIILHSVYQIIALKMRIDTKMKLINPLKMRC